MFRKEKVNVVDELEANSHGNSASQVQGGALRGVPRNDTQ
jgi:hypothetical protein